MPRQVRPIRAPLRAGLAAGLLALGGCESLRHSAPNSANTSSESPPAAPKKPGGLNPPLRVGPFVFYHDGPLPESDPVFRDLETLPEQLQRELRLPVGATVVQVYLFADQERYEAFMRDRYPKLPPRRAFFITGPARTVSGSAGDDLQVYTYVGDHLRVDLRHELTHGLLHGVLKGVPMWLDEGLAGFFEQPVEQDGLNFDHLEKLRRSTGGPDLARLERIGEVEQMGKAEYREAWAWVHYCLRGPAPARQVLLSYLQELRQQPAPAPLWPRLKDASADPSGELVGHLARLAESHRVGFVPALGAAYNAPETPPPANPTRRR